MKNIKSLFTLLLVLSIGLANAQKTAFINEAKLLKATPGYEQATAKMDTLKVQMQNDLQAVQTVFSAKVNNLLKPYNFSKELTAEQIKAKLSETDKKKFDLLQEESKLLEKQAKAKEEEYQEVYNQKVGTILEKVNQSVKDYCKKNKIDVLYKIDQLQPAIAYVEDKTDITSALINIVKP